MVLGAEFLMSSITHFYHLAAPSYIQGPAIPPWTPFFADSQYHGLLVNVDNAALPNVPGATASNWAGGGNRDVWDAVIISYVRALRVRRLVFEAGALFAGRMPMTSCFVGGGVTNDYSENIDARVAKYKELMTEVAGFVLSEYIPIALVLGLLYPNFDNAVNAGNSPFTDPLKPVAIGAGLGQFLAWGAYPNLDNTLTSEGGVAGLPSGNFTVSNKTDVYNTWLHGGTHAVDVNLKEHIENSRYSISSLDATAAVYGADEGAYPGAVARTRPDRGHGYTYIKSPRWDGYAMEVGPFARLVVGGIYPVSGSLWGAGVLAAAAGYYFLNTTPGSAQLDGTKIAPTIVQALVNAGVLNANGTGTVAEWILGLNGGLSTMDRIRARALEAVVLLHQSVGILPALGGTAWIDEPILKNTAQPTCRNLPIPVGTVQGWGAHEAARGALMHQAKITGGKIVAYQCIVPTTWNGAPKTTLTTRGLQRGAIEQACMGAPYDAATQTFTTQAGVDSAPTQGGVEVLRIAQSFDPCIACAVH